MNTDLIIPPTDNTRYSPEFVDFFEAVLGRLQKIRDDAMSEGGYNYSNDALEMLEATKDNADRVIVYACYFPAPWPYAVKQAYSALSDVHEGKPVAHIFSQRHIDVFAEIAVLPQRGPNGTSPASEALKLRATTTVFTDFSLLDRVIVILGRVSTVKEFEAMMEVSGEIAKPMITGSL